MDGVWITFSWEPYDGCWEIVPHVSHAGALFDQKKRKSSSVHVRFVKFGEELEEPTDPLGSSDVNFPVNQGGTA